VRRVTGEALREAGPYRGRFATRIELQPPRVGRAKRSQNGGTTPLRRWLGAWLGAAACAVGCATTTPRATAPAQHWVPGYVFGIWGKAELDVRDDCPRSAAASVRIGATWATLLVSVVTLGVYTPREVQVECQTQR
jgi:hypothetical protein